MRLYLSTPVSNPLTVTERVKWIKLQIITKEQMRHDKLFSQAEERQLKRQMGYPNQNWNTGQRTHSYISSVNFQDN